MRGRNKHLKEVTAYVWDFERCGPVYVSRETFWPNGDLYELDGKTYALLDFDCCPKWDMIDGEWRPVEPTRELLECGHELPMRRRGKGGCYLLPRRVCFYCLMST